MSRKKICGCDLGTGFSAVAVVETNGEPKIIFNSEGKSTTPSVVSISDEGVKVGEPAKRQMVIRPTNTISSIKRFMGESFDNVKEEVERAQYKVVRNENNQPRVDINGKLYSPQEISAMILQKMKKTAEDYLGTEVTDFVITCPAYYDNTQREAVKLAGEIAGINVVRVINEPTAAALSFGLGKGDKEMKILVADIGCGTSDFTILDMDNGVFEVIATNGNLHLGGTDFDDKIIDWIVDEFKSENGFDLGKDPMAMQRIKEAAEKAKIELSSSTSTEINLPYISVVDGAPVHLVKTLTRAKFEQMSDDLITEIIELSKSCLEKANYGVSDIDEVILVGGSTRIPAIQTALEKQFGKKPNKSVNPDEAVALGAAIQGAILAGDESVGDVVLLDVTPLSLGIETLGGVFTKLVDANTTIPTTKTETFSTAVDNQPSVEIVVLQGERPMAKDNKRLGVFHLDGIMPAPKGVPQIEVSFDIDANGILSVSAKDKATGKDSNIRIEASSGLSDEEIQRMKDEASANAESDKKEFERVNTLNQAENTVFQTQKQIDELGDKLTEEQKSKLENDLNALKDASDRKDVDACKSCMETLTKTWNEIATVLYGQGQQNGGAQQGTSFEDMMNGFNSQQAQ
jgi:molecular chaperone DnaK